MKALLTWIGANIWTIIICAALVSIVAFIIVYMIRQKKKGRSSCGCSCGSCAMNCHARKDQ
ncbi:MAG: FeoB-associated Cys-rich membrane protein [Ruminococcaceae bacterium]|nr:FeoB-associated Cys-rich membrane protein [Oscillospiraceae bacterium]